MAVIKRLSDEAEELLRRVVLEKIPKHIAIIMDGNGRWARRRRLRRVVGHKQGTEAVRQAVKACKRLDRVRYLTLYAFSLENWKRPATEISTLMTILEDFLKKEEQEMLENDISLKYIGRIDDLPLSTRSELIRVSKSTANCKSLTLTLALSYSGRSEIVDAVKKLIEYAKKRKNDVVIDEETFSKFLYTNNMEDPDLLVRTGGEMRVSNFLLWQIAYTEIYITDVLWPDFRDFHLIEAVLDYQKRERRFGGVEPIV
ncbi:MAG: isoprenyl transferase [bacterium]